MEPDTKPSSNDKVPSFFSEGDKTTEILHFEKSKKMTRANHHQKQLNNHLN